MSFFRPPPPTPVPRDPVYRHRYRNIKDFQIRKQQWLQCTGTTLRTSTRLGTFECLWAVYTTRFFFLFQRFRSLSENKIRIVVLKKNTCSFLSAFGKIRRIGDFFKCCCQCEENGRLRRWSQTSDLINRFGGKTVALIAAAMIITYFDIK